MNIRTDEGISTPLVSIIMPVYNGEDYLAQTIESVINQTISDWELLAADNGSNDQSAEIIKHYAEKDQRIKYVQATEKKGAAYARNCGIKKAQGRFIAFIDADDLWRTDKLDVQLREMEKHNAALSFSWYYEFEGQPENIVRQRAPKRKIFKYKHILRNSSVGCSTAMYDSQILGKRYMPEIKMRQDWLLWLSILKEHDGLCIHDYLAYYRLTPNSLSADKVKAAQYQWLALREGLGFPLYKSAFYFTTYLVHHVLRIAKARLSASRT